VERLAERLQIARRALGTLQEALREPATALIRDASIQRFEYTYEAAWKAAQLYLRATENLELASPTAVTRACYRSKILTEELALEALQMAQDRNLTVHTYNEELADRIYSRLPGYAALLERWLAAMTGAPGR
jgi:nucleotidyltransferase substrate binding protein (TIGR01987 family)